MAYELLVLDIDGTVTNSKKEITPKTLEAIMNLQENGQHVVLASGRPTAGILHVAKELKLDEYNGWVLAFNGGRIMNYKTKEVIYNRSLPKETIPEIYQMAVDHHAGIITYEGDVVISGNGLDQYNQLEARINRITMKEVECFPEYVNFDINKCLLTGEPDKMEELEVLMKEKFGEKLNIFRSEPFFLEIMPQNIDKAYSLGKLLERIGLSRRQMICCGDGFNDVSMIKYAGMGVAMKNAQESVKEVADFITYSNDEDGIAHVIEKFMLKG